MQPYGRPPSSPTTSRDTKATISVSSYFCIGRTLIGGFIERGAPIKRRQLARIFRANLLHGSPRLHPSYFSRYLSRKAWFSRAYKLNCTCVKDYYYRYLFKIS